MPDTAEPRPAPWRGRRRVPDPKDCFVAVRCTAAEHAAITARAEAAGLSTGAYLRTVALGSAGPRAVKRPSVNRVVLAQLLGAIGHLGSNVNQLAKAANRGSIPARDELAAAVEAIDAIRSEVMKALGRDN